MQCAMIYVFHKFYCVGVRIWKIDWIVSLYSTLTLENPLLILFQTQPFLIICYLVI